MPRRHDIVGVIRVGNGCAIHLNLRGDGSKVPAREGLGKHELGSVRHFKRCFGNAVVKRLKRCAIINGGHGFDVFELHAVCKGKGDESHGSRNGADEDEGRAPAKAACAFIRNCAEQRKHEKRENVVQRHDDARICLGHTKFVG